MTPSKISLLLAGVLLCNVISAQELKVLKSPDQNKVDISTDNGIATIMFSSNVKGLTIESKEGLRIVKGSDKLWLTYIDAKSEIEQKECCYTEFLLKSPKTNELLLRSEDIQPGQVIYYTVILPDTYPVCLNLEYVYTPTSICGLRLSFGGKYGGYLSYKWGKYYKAGTDIGEVSSDYDVSKANFLGYIRTGITGGFRMGILNKDIIGLHFLVGGGYGEYGRQWENPLEVEKNIYFYSDYIQGFEGEVAVQATLFKYVSASVGVGALFGGGKVSVEPQIGVGLNLPLNVFSKKRVKK